jgi:hypothetical protein
MKYIIAQTWNGEGASYLNTASVIEFNSDSEAQKYIEQLLVDDIGEDDDDWDITIKRGCIIAENEEDAGTYQWMHLKEDTYGVVILTNVNDMDQYNEVDYLNELDTAMAQSDPQDEIEVDNPFICAHMGEYDYQFIKLA